MKKIAGQKIIGHYYNTVIVGAGASSMNCAKKLYEYMHQKGIEEPEKRIAVVTAGLALGASRMSGSDKQTYYKMGTSPDVADSAESFAKSLTAAGCCHGDLALAEAIGSLRGFYNLVETGVPFPHDSIGTYVGYKTDHDPYERATSAGPKTSKFMSECLERIVRRCNISIFDYQEVAELLTKGRGQSKRIVGVITLNKKKLSDSNFALNIFYCENLVLAAGGPGALYEASVYPPGQTGIHGVAFRAGLIAENLTESQFGLASIKFRWNVSGTYMQAIPRIFSTDAKGKDKKDFLADFFPTMSKLVTNIFLKGYQWPFDPQRIENFQSSLVDVLVFNETQKGRHVFMDFTRNPVGNDNMKKFCLEDLEDEALSYLKAAGAVQRLPIERLEHMNSPAIEIYKEHGIDLYTEPLEIAVCAQHNNGGFTVNKWWESSIKNTFVIGEMAGTHGIKRPGGSALNAGQVGAQRAAEYIANVYSSEISVAEESSETDAQLQSFVDKLRRMKSENSKLTPIDAIAQIQHKMTASAGHMRELKVCSNAFDLMVNLYKEINAKGFKLTGPKDIVTAVQAQHLTLSSIAYLKAILELLKDGGGSRGSHLVLDENGIQVYPDIKDSLAGKPIRFKPENEELRNSILSVEFDGNSEDFFRCRVVPVRPAPSGRKAFEPAWTDYRKGKIYS